MKGKGNSSKPMPKMPKMGKGHMMAEHQMSPAEMKKHQGSGMPKHK